MPPRNRSRGEPPPGETEAAALSWPALLLVFVLALGIRLAYLAEMGDSLFFAELMGDGAAFDAQAQSLASDGWRGEGVYYQAPLYSHVLALAYSWFGRDLELVRLVQALLGAASAVLVAEAARRFFESRRVGLAAGLLMALYAPAIFYDGLLQKTSLATFLLSLLVLLLALTRTRPTAWLFLAAGLTQGLLALTRENLVVLVFPALVVIASAKKGRLRCALAFAAGLFLVLLPVGLRNQAVGGEFVLGATNFGTNLYIGNHAGADGLYQPLVPGRGHAGFEATDARVIAEARTGRALGAREVSDYWRGEALGWMRTEPLSALALLVRKLHYVSHAREWMDSQSFVVFREESRVLSLLAGLFRFGLIGPLALLGLALAWRRRRTELAPLALAIPLVASSVALFFVFGRFRFSLVPLLMPFAAFALLELVARVRQPRTLLWPIGLLALFLGLVHWPLPAGLEYPRSDTFNNLASALAKADRPRAAEALYRRAVDAAPDYAAPRLNLGRALIARGALDEADEHLARAASLEPAWAGEIHLLRAGAALASAAGERAREELSAFGDLAGHTAEELVQAGVLWRQLGDPRAAETAYRAALAQRPTLATAHNNLGYLLELEGRREAAASRYEVAVQLEPDYPEALVNLAWLRASAREPELRDGAAALGLAERALALAGEQRAGLLDLKAAAQAEAGQHANACATAEAALHAAARAGQSQLAFAIRARLELYRAGQPYRSR